MNYLAHLLLAPHTDAGWVGAMLGDFVKGPLRERFDSDITQSIKLHRAIDAYTDAHVITRRARARFSSARRRAAGIIVDVTYDHFLALHWHEYCAVDIRHLTRSAYDALSAHEALLPPRLRALAPRLAETDWLSSYGCLDRVGDALDAISRRLTRPELLEGSLSDVKKHYGGLALDFHEFFPHLNSHVARLRSSPDFTYSLTRAP